MRGVKVSYEGKQWKEKPERHRWSRFSFAELIDKGILRQKYAYAGLSPNDLSNYTSFVEYFELIESELVRNFRMFDTYTRDASHLTEEEHSSLTDPLEMAFGHEFRIWLKMPLPIGYYSVLLPRYAVTLASEAPQVDYRQTDLDKYFENRVDEMPQSSNVVLVAEYSIDTLTFGGVDKEDLYALAGIPEYWVYRVPDRVLEVHRDPVQMQDRRLKYGYRSSQQYSNQESVSPLAAPHSEIAVADIARGVQLARSVW